MSTINDQLRLPTIPGGASLMQPALYNGAYANERAYAYEFPLVKGAAYWNASGIKNNWDGHYTSASGADKFPKDPEKCVRSCWMHHALNKSKRDKCLHGCASIVGGLIDPNLPEQGTYGTYDPSQDPERQQEQTPTDADTPVDTKRTLSKGAKIGIGIAVVGALAAGVYFLAKRRK